MEQLNIESKPMSATCSLPFRKVAWYLRELFRIGPEYPGRGINP